MTAADRARLSLLLVVALALQVTLAGEVRIAGVHPDLMVLMPVAAGIVGGPDRGAIVGFVSGLLADLFLQTPFGLSALAFTIVGYAVGLVQGGVLRAAWWIPVVTAVLASAGGEVVYALIGAIVGQDQMLAGRLLRVLAVVGAVNGLLALVVVPAMVWATGGRARRPSRAGRW